MMLEALFILLVYAVAGLAGLWLVLWLAQGKEGHDA